MQDIYCKGKKTAGKESFATLEQKMPQKSKIKMLRECKVAIG